MNAAAFKACDLRGRCPEEVSPALAYGLGRAMATQLGPGARVTIAGDFRLTTGVLKAALEEGLIASGARVVDAGQLPTPIAYFAHDRWRTDAVVIVTASHSPADHNGFKLLAGSEPPTPAYIQALREVIEERAFVSGAGQVERRDPVPAYREWILDRWAALAKVTRAKAPVVVLDAGSGAWGCLGPALFSALGFVVEPLFCEIDGSFPHRPPDSARPAHLHALRRAVIRHQAALGIAWDGDGDRVAFVDETGTSLTADEMAIVLASALLDQERGAPVVLDIKLADVVRQMVCARGGRPILQRSGHAFMKQAMRNERALVGLEASGHYFFREIGGGDDGLFAALLVASLCVNETTLGMLRRQLPPIFATPEIRLPAALMPYERVSAALRLGLGRAALIEIDGIKIQNADGSVLIRPSVTEAASTLRVEGVNEGALRRLLATVVSALPEVRQAIERELAPGATIAHVA